MVLQPSIQLDLFEMPPRARDHGGTAITDTGEEQVRAASAATSALMQPLMEQLCRHENLRRAYKRVKANQGAPGVDGMRVEELGPWLVTHEAELVKALLEGTYRPQPLRNVEIDKPGGGKRLLRIPTVIDRLVQQAITQVLQPLFDPSFSASSFGFRPGRSAHQALHQAQRYVETGYEIVVDMDLERFFDTVNQDRLMSLLARRITDKGLLGLIRQILRGGILDEGLQTVLGVPQGGPLSPLLSNVVLDELDQELERRGHRFCRYADDCNIFVRTPRAAERVLASITRYVEGRLLLRVNRRKSAIGHSAERTFLGHVITTKGLKMADQSLKRFKARIRLITSRKRGVSLKQVIAEVKQYTRGWVVYFRYAQCWWLLREFDGWIRRKLRCYRLKQCNRVNAVRRFLEQLGAARGSAWRLARSGKGWWRKSISPPAYWAMTNKWFKEQGLASLEARHKALSH